MFKLTSTRYLVLGILDFAVIEIIIYGLTDFAYSGYPAWLPYLLIAFFLFMATSRFYKFSSTLKKSEALDSHNIESLFSENDSDNGNDDAVDTNGFRKRRSR